MWGMFVLAFYSNLIMHAFGLEMSIHSGYRNVLQPGAEAQAPKPAGMLFCKVVEATNIPHVDWKSYFSKPDTQVV